MWHGRRGPGRFPPWLAKRELLVYSPPRRGARGGQGSGVPEADPAPLPAMGRDKRSAVSLALTPDPDLLPVVEGLVGGLAEQMGFAENHRLNLQQGVERACRRLMPPNAGGEGDLALGFAGFSQPLGV